MVLVLIVIVLNQQDITKHLKAKRQEQYSLISFLKLKKERHLIEKVQMNIIQQEKVKIIKKIISEKDDLKTYLIKLGKI